MIASDTKVSEHTSGMPLTLGGPVSKAIGKQRTGNPNPRVNDVALLEYLRQLSSDHAGYLSMRAPR